MTDLSKTIAPKSDQMNFDDFVSGESKTIKITKISGNSEPQQPISINYEGDKGKPYKPCLSMRRVLVNAWGADGISYVGKSLTLYGDPKVVFGGIAVGGIRISHLSDIPAPLTMALTASKSSRKPYTVQPLKAAPAGYVLKTKSAERAYPTTEDRDAAVKKLIEKLTPEQIAELKLLNPGVVIGD